MSDIKLAIAPFLDISTTDNDLSRDSGLENAVILSVFLDARAEIPDALENDPRGWWGDEFGEVPYGSQLWRLARERPNDATAAEVRRVAKKALAWLVKFRVAESVEVDASFEGSTLRLGIFVKKSGQNTLRGKYSLNWSQYGLAA